MLFRKKLPRSCLYCSFGTKLSEDHVLCIKHGVVSAQKPCRKFSYDPCKRVPPRLKAVDFVKYEEEDFTL